MHAMLRSCLSFRLAKHPMIRNALSPEIAHSLLGVRQPWFWVQALSVTGLASYFPWYLSWWGLVRIKYEVNDTFCCSCHCHHHHHHHHCTIILFCNQNPAIGRPEARLIWCWTDFLLRTSMGTGVWDDMGCKINSKMETNKPSSWRKGTWNL